MSIPDGSQFDPRIIVELFRDDGTGITIGDDNPANFRQPCIGIDLKRTRVGDTNKGVVKLYNLSDDMRAALRLGEFTKILIRAGFVRANNIANIWEGDIRKSPPDHLGTDIVSTIYTTEGHQLFVKATVNRTWAAGTDPPLSKPRYLFDGINIGDLSGITGREPFKKPYTASTSVREFFDDFMRTFDARWSVQRNTLDWIRNDTFSDAFQVVKKDFNTGLIDADLDEAAVDAIFALDAAIDPNGAVQIDHSARPSVNGFWRANDVRHHGSVGGQNDCIFTDIVGEKLEGVNVIDTRQERISLRA